MKKFGFLLAIVALFAMSTMAFAEDTVSVGDEEVIATAHNNSKVSESKANVYFFKGTTPSLDIALNLELATGVASKKFGAEVSKDVILGANTADNTDAVANTFQIGTKHTNHSDDITMKFSVYDGTSKEEESGITAATITVTPVSVDVVLSADGKAVSEAATYLNRPLTKKTLSVELDKVEKATDINSYTLVLVSSDQALSVDKVATAATSQTLEVKGLTYTLAIDSEKALSLAVEGTPTEEGIYTVAVTSKTDQPAVDTSKKVYVAGATKLTDKDKAEYYCLATFTLRVKKAPSDQVIDVISADATLSADIVALLSADKTQASKGILLTVSNDKYILNGAAPAPKALSDDESVEMTLAFLTLDADGKLVASLDKAPASVTVDIRRDVDLEVRTASFDINGGKNANVEVTDGVAQINITKGTATTDGYTAFIVRTPVTTETIRGAAAPKAEDVYRSQKFNVKLSSTNTNTSSSSGACSMGAGLVALAGLALVLRKKD